MKSVIRILKNNWFILITGVIYYFSFSGLAVGDPFYQSMETGYPLFLRSDYLVISHWFGFLAWHLLNYPTLRLIQILLAKIGLLPHPLVLFQAVNLILSLATLKLIYSILLKMDITKLIAMATTILFGFSFAFYSNMNAEFHHFGVFLVAAIILLLVDIEKTKILKWNSVFMLCFCLTLAPLYHIENIIYSAIVILYIFIKKDLRWKFKSHLYSIISGLVICPLILVICAFTFHYWDLGRPGVIKYISEIPAILWMKRFTSIAGSAYTNVGFSNVYIMLRAFLESFSIVSRVAKVIQHYQDIVFYSSPFSVNLTIGIVVIYCLVFAIVSLIVGIFFLKNWNKVASLVKLLLIMLLAHILGFDIFMNLLLSEFYITPVMIYCILLGYVFNKQSRQSKFIYLILVILTVISNVYLYFYPQKVSASSINRIFNDIESQNKNIKDFVVVRVSLFNFPYEVNRRSNFRIYFDEHAYESRPNTVSYLDSVDEEFNKNKKVFLIAPAFLFGDSQEINIDSVVPMCMDEIPVLVENLKYFLERIKHKYKLVITKKYYYNFATLGQLGKLAIVELR